MKKQPTINDLYASDDFMLGFKAGEVKAKNTIRKKGRGKIVYAWAVPNRMGGIACFTAQMPIFWNRTVAKEYAIQRGDKKDNIIRVVIEIL